VIWENEELNLHSNIEEWDLDQVLFGFLGIPIFLGSPFSKVIIFIVLHFSHFASKSVIFRIHRRPVQGLGNERFLLPHKKIRISLDTFVSYIL
jgi:hypothetical protein